MKNKFEIDIELFAGLMARLDDPFADRATVLAEAGLTEHGSEDLAVIWRTRLAEPSSGELYERFAAAYTRARATSGRRPHTSPEAPGKGAPRAAPSWAVVPGAPGLTETAEMGAVLPMAALPFTSSPELPKGAITAKGDSPRPKTTFDTEPIDTRVFRPKDPLPFQSPNAPTKRRPR